MSKIFGGIAIGLGVAAIALLTIEEIYKWSYLNSDPVAALLGGFITAAAVIAFGLLLVKGGWVPFLEKKRKQKTVALYLLRESGPMEGPKLMDYDSVSLTAAVMHLRNGDAMQRVIVSDGERVLVLEADGSWQAGGVSETPPVPEYDELL